MTTTTVDHLEIARGLIKAGWVKHRGSLRTKDGKVSYCAIGALAIADANHEAYELVHKHLREVLGLSRDHAISTLNDWAWTRKRHVLKAFDRAIAEAEQHVRDNVIHVNF